MATSYKRPVRRRAYMAQRRKRRRIYFICTVLAMILLIVVIVNLRKGSNVGQQSISVNSGAGSQQLQDSTAQVQPTQDGGTEAIVSNSQGEPTSGSGQNSNSQVIDEYSQDFEVDYINRTTNRPLGIPECEPVGAEYFDDAVFIGDSVTLKLYYYVRDKRVETPGYMGNCEFLVAGSMGSGNAMHELSEDSIHPTYRGEKMLLEDAVAKIGAKKVYIMLGMNDIAVYGVEESARNLMKLVGRILEKSPDAEIFIQSMTPRMDGDYKNLNNDNIFEYNLLLYQCCITYKDYGLHFVDVAYVMRDDKGNLPAGYCSDPDGMKLHFTNSGCKAWLEYLRTHALV